MMKGKQMAKQTWSFVSNTQKFDGMRLATEAAQAGLQVFTVERGGMFVTLCTRAFMDRLAKAGLRATVEFGPSIPVIRGGMLTVDPCQDSPYVGVLSVNSDQVMALVKAAEAKKQLTLLSGYSE